MFYKQECSRKLDGHAFLAFVFCVIVLLTIYLPGINGPLIHDDFLVFTPLFERSQLELYSNGIMSNTGMLGRPISMFSFLVNVDFFGDSVKAMKTVNIILHLANFFLVVVLSNLLLQIQGIEKFKEHKNLVSILAGFIWASHPLHVSTVLYTVQRMTELSAFFSFSGMILYCSGRLQTTSSHKQVINLRILAAFICAIPLAALSKENGILLPVFYLLIELILFKACGLKSKLVFYYVVFLLLPGVIGSLYYIFKFEARIVEASLNYGYHYYERVFTEFRILIDYLGMIFFPHTSSMSFYYDDYIISRNLYTPLTTLYSALFILLLILFAIRIRKNYPLISLGILFYFFAHSLESGILPLQLMYEHRNYLPSFGCALFVLSVFQVLKNHTTAKINLMIVPALILPLLLSFRVLAWSDHTSLVIANFSARPQSESTRADYAELLSQNGKYNEAIKLLEQRISSTGAQFQRLYIQCLKDKKIYNEDLSRIEPEDLIAQRVYAVSGLMEISRLALENRCQIDYQILISKLKEFSKERMAISGWKENLMIHVAHHQYANGKIHDAFESLEELADSGTVSAIPNLLASQWYLKNGQIEAAIDNYKRGLMLVSRSRQDYSKTLSVLMQEFSEKGIDVKNF